MHTLQIIQNVFSYWNLLFVIPASNCMASSLRRNHFDCITIIIFSIHAQFYQKKLNALRLMSSTQNVQVSDSTILNLDINVNAILVLEIQNIYCLPVSHFKKEPPGNSSGLRSLKPKHLS